MGELLVLPHGARVMGLFAGAHDHNLLWVHPSLGQAATARESLTATEWVHLGGDRTWVSPEYELHLGDLARPWDTYRVPAAVDPGSYSLSQAAGHILLRGRAKLFFNRQQRSSEVEIEKSVRLLADPLRLEAGQEEWAGVDYAGYELTTRLRQVDPPSGGPAMSLWNILVVPADGWAIIPVWGQARVRDYMSPTPPERLLQAGRALCFRLDGREQHKVGLRAADVAGRAGFLRALDTERSSLVVRAFSVNPSGEYVDSPWDAPDELGYAFQSYNDGGGLGGFGELEYHTPAIGGRTSLSEHSDVCQVWGYIGPTAAIERVARQILGSDSLSALPARS